MNIFKLLITFLFLTAILFAKSSVWVAKSKRGELYLGGSVHILRSSDYPLPKEFEKAYNNSEILIFETDIGASKESLQKLVLEKGMYPAGTNLQDKLTKETYKKLQNYCAKLNFPIAFIEQMRVSLATATLSFVEYSKLGINVEHGVDNYFYKEALRDKKEIKILESIEEQMEFLVKMGEGKEDLFVQQFLKDADKTNRYLIKIIEAWRVGDEKTIELFLQDLKKYPNSYDELVTQRNNNWMKKIEKYLQTPQKEFIIVGAAHLVGEDGILKQLKDLGYTIERFE